MVAYNGKDHCQDCDALAFFYCIIFYPCCSFHRLKLGCSQYYILPLQQLDFYFIFLFFIFRIYQLYKIRNYVSVAGQPSFLEPVTCLSIVTWLHLVCLHMAMGSCVLVCLFVQLYLNNCDQQIPLWIMKCLSIPYSVHGFNTATIDLFAVM